MDNTKRSEGPVIIAVCGKGGVGKTSVSAMLTRCLAADGEKKLLAIDADPAVGLATALGLTVAQTVDDVRSAIINDLKSGRGGNKAEIMARIDYQMLGTLAEHDNTAFLAIGRPEDEGCYCRLNAFLRAMIAKLAHSFDYVVIDAEAGIEQINRRVMEMVTHLILVSDGSLKSHHVAGMIAGVAGRYATFREIGLLVNRCRPGDNKNAIAGLEGIPLLGCVPEDDTIREFDAAGSPFFALPSCAALRAVEDAAAGIIGAAKTAAAAGPGCRPG